jgi:hypothetical protein
MRYFCSFIILSFLACNSNNSNKHITAIDKNKVPDPAALATRFANENVVEKATQEAKDSVRIIRHNNVTLEIRDLKGVYIYNEQNKILWKYEPAKGVDMLDIYDEMLSANGRYACIRPATTEETNKVIFIDIFNNTTHEYVSSLTGDNHYLWEAYTVSNEGEASVILKKEKDGKIYQKVIHTYLFKTK